MTKKDVIKLLAILSAYYGKSKADAESMVNAWYLLLKDYDYQIAEQAVFEYAKNDSREYSQFPQIGAIIDSIEQEEKSFNIIRNAALESDITGMRYERLPERCKKWISKERFERLQHCPEEYLLNNIAQIKRALCSELQEGKNDKGKITEDSTGIKSAEKSV